MVSNGSLNDKSGVGVFLGEMKYYDVVNGDSPFPHHSASFSCEISSSQITEILCTVTSTFIAEKYSSVAAAVAFLSSRVPIAQHHAPMPA